MATLGNVYAALPEFRVQLQNETLDNANQVVPMGMPSAFRGGLSAFRTPLTNVHATGVGVRMRGGKIYPKDFVLKVYVFEKADLGTATPALTRRFRDVEVDVEQLPIQLAYAVARKRVRPEAALANRERHRPIVGGVSIAPVNEAYVGTLGCFVRRKVADSEQIFALSNNHVLADTNRLPVGTPIVQPGPEAGTSGLADAFATLSEFIPIRFSTERFNRETNRFDAALARVTKPNLIKREAILGVGTYEPVVGAPLPGMRVTKSGRTTGVTTGIITAVGVNGVQINYGTPTNNIIATFNDTVEIVGDDGRPFSGPGDSGSVILDAATGKPVALLFAGDGRTTTACSFAGVCRHFRVTPI